MGSVSLQSAFALPFGTGRVLGLGCSLHLFIGIAGQVAAIFWDVAWCCIVGSVHCIPGKSACWNCSLNPKQSQITPVSYHCLGLFCLPTFLLPRPALGQALWKQVILIAIFVVHDLYTCILHYVYDIIDIIDIIVMYTILTKKKKHIYKFMTMICSLYHVYTMYILYIPYKDVFFLRRLCGNGEASWAAVRRAGATGRAGNFRHRTTSRWKRGATGAPRHENLIKCMKNAWKNAWHIQVLISKWISPENYPCSKRLRIIERSGVWFSWCYGFIRLLISALCRSLSSLSKSWMSMSWHSGMTCLHHKLQHEQKNVVARRISRCISRGLRSEDYQAQALPLEPHWTATVFVKQRWKLKVSQRHH